MDDTQQYFDNALKIVLGAGEVSLFYFIRLLTNFFLRPIFFFSRSY